MESGGAGRGPYREADKPKENKYKFVIYFDGNKSEYTNVPKSDKERFEAWWSNETKDEFQLTFNSSRGTHTFIRKYISSFLWEVLDKD